jgi:protein O-GlcNAc transferase
LSQLRQFDRARDCFDRASAFAPDSAEAWLGLGNACGALRRHEQGLAAYDRALAIEPQLAAAWIGRGNVLCELDCHAEALACFDKALEFDAGSAAAWLGCGNAHNAAKRNSEALAAYDRALALDPESAGAWLGRGNVFGELARPDEAVAAYGEALARDPGLAQAYLGRGNVLAAIARYQDALECYAKALALRPDLAEAWLGRGNVLKELGDNAGALAAFESALRYAPELPGLQGIRFQTKLHFCNWDDFQTERAQLIARIRQGQSVRPFDALTICDSAEDLYLGACAFSERNWPWSNPSPVSRQSAPRRRDRIRLAYMSSDFRGHPVAYLMTDIFERHDRSRFDTTAISIGPDDDSPVRERLRAAFGRFVETRAMTDQEIAALIEDAEIDILVDLMAFTRGARTGVIARRPAPIQVNYLGFPGTMGMRQIDYIVADRVVIPDSQRRFFSEKIAYLPFTYNPNGGDGHDGSTPPTRSDVGLPAEACVFCCFNNSYKILPDVFDVWMRILRKVEGSVLWLLEDRPATSDNLRKEAAARGVAPERLIFARRAPRAEHLARHACADLFLDTLPYNAHTTAGDALREGLPVLTLAGQSFAARVAASLLTALELPELITRTPEDYERLAVALARSPGQLAGVRAKLAANRVAMPAFDTARFTRLLEAAFATMVERQRAGLPPDDFAVSASAG